MLVLLWLEMTKRRASYFKASLENHINLCITDRNGQSLTGTPSFVCVNNVVFCKAGLPKTVDKGKRSLVQCDICTKCW